MEVDSGIDQPAETEPALHLWLAVHIGDIHMCEKEGVPLRNYSGGPEKLYICLRQCKVEATNRIVQVSGQTCPISKHTIVLFSLKCNRRGFFKYATKALGADRRFQTQVHKRAYSDNSKDWGVWCFYGDLLLQEEEAGEVLIHSEWKYIA